MSRTIFCQLRSLVGTGAWLVLLAVSTSAASAQVPETIFSEKATDSIPIWVTSESVKEGEEIRWDLLPIPAEAELRDLFEQASSALATDPTRYEAGRSEEVLRQRMAEECQVWKALPPHSLGGSNLEEIARRASRIYSGVVADERAGFFHGRLGTLYQVTMGRLIKDAKGTPLPEDVFLFFPEARFDFGGLTICSTARRDFSSPAIGQRILWFSSNEELVGDSLVSHPNPANVLFQAENGELFVSSRLAKMMRGKQLDWLEVELEEMAWGVE